MFVKMDFVHGEERCNMRVVKTEDLTRKIERNFLVDFLTQVQLTEFIEDSSFEAEPTKWGRWKPFDLTWGRSIYACTNCGEAFEVPTEMGTPIFIYCPNCGARMIDGVEENES